MDSREAEPLVVFPSQALSTRAQGQLGTVLLAKQLTGKWSYVQKCSALCPFPCSEDVLGQLSLFLPIHDS